MRVVFHTASLIVGALGLGLIAGAQAAVGFTALTGGHVLQGAVSLTILGGGFLVAAGVLLWDAGGSPPMAVTVQLGPSDSDIEELVAKSGPGDFSAIGGRKP